MARKPRRGAILLQLGLLTTTLLAGSIAGPAPAGSAAPAPRGLFGIDLPFAVDEDGDTMTGPSRCRPT